MKDEEHEDTHETSPICQRTPIDENREIIEGPNGEDNHVNCNNAPRPPAATNMKNSTTVRALHEIVWLARLRAPTGAPTAVLAIFQRIRAINQM